MPRKGPQTRRAISVRGELYNKAKVFAEASGMSLSQLTETGLGGVMSMMSSSSVELTKEDRDSACELLNEIAEFGVGQYGDTEKNEAARQRAARLLNKLLSSEVRGG